MSLASPDVPATPPEIALIQQYVWTRYVEHGQPEQPVDEVDALTRLETYYGADGMDSDSECFYYGILAYERSFAEPARSTELLERALAAFRAYRRQTSGGFSWEAVEDRYQETLELLKRVTRTTR